MYFDKNDSTNNQNEKVEEILGLGDELYNKAQEIHALESEVNEIIAQLNELMGTKTKDLYINHALDEVENFAQEAQTIQEP